jgi:hypothetical protein
MNENLRAINPIGISGIDITEPSTGLPAFEWVDPTTLYIDPAYQRDISDRGYRQIRRIVAGFDWTKFKPPICAISEVDGQAVLKVLDGQHTAIAAASHPSISKIPVMLVEAPDRISQAKAFVGHNTERLGVTGLQLHQAALAAADEDAQTIELVCARANVTVLKHPNSHGESRPRETTAIATIRALVERHKPIVARQVLEVIANAEMGQITAPQIKAVELLLTDPEYSDKFEHEDLTNAMVDLLYTADEEAKLFAVTHKVTFWKALAITWFRKTKKRRGSAGRAA